MIAHELHMNDHWMTHNKDYVFVEIGYPIILENVANSIFPMPPNTSVLQSARISGADPGFQVRGGALKKIAPSGGRREKIWGISCEKSRFYAKKLYCFQLRREARKFLGYFV